MPKMMPPSTSIWWVPASGVTDPDVDLFKPSLYTGSGTAVDLTCAVVTGYTLNPTDSDTDDTRSICDEGNVQTPTVQNFEASMTFFREKMDSEASGDSVYDKAFNLFKTGIQDGSFIDGYLVERIGYRKDVPVAAGHVLSAYHVIADNPRNEIGDGSTPIQFTVPFLPQGWFRINKAVVDEG